MKLNITKWRPDTCGCEIDYQWDADEPAETRVHTPVRTVTCAFHTGTKEKVYEDVKNENKNKNLVVNTVMKDADIAEDIPDGKGGTIRKVKAGKDVKWSFDANRKLEIEVLGVDQKKKDDILTELNKIVDEVTIK